MIDARYYAFWSSIAVVFGALGLWIVYCLRKIMEAFRDHE